MKNFIDLLWITQTDPVFVLQSKHTHIWGLNQWHTGCFLEVSSNAESADAHNTKLLLSHLDGFESAEAIFRAERGGLWRHERAGLGKIQDGDGGGDGAGQVVHLQVDVHGDVGPQQVWSQHREPAAWQ